MTAARNVTVCHKLGVSKYMKVRILSLNTFFTARSRPQPSRLSSVQRHVHRKTLHAVHFTSLQDIYQSGLDALLRASIAYTAVHVAPRKPQKWMSRRVPHPGHLGLDGIGQ